MPRLTADTSARRRADIIAAALRLFQSKGFQGTSMADIIRESGMSAGSIYSHFASKYDLVASASAATYARLEKRLASLNVSDADITPSVLINHIALVLEKSLPTRLAMHIWVDAQADPLLREHAMTNLTRLTDSMARALAPWARAHGRDAGATATVLILAFQGYVARSSIDSRFTRARFIATLGEVFDR